MHGMEFVQKNEASCRLKSALMQECDSFSELETLAAPIVRKSGINAYSIHGK
jgi:hypothetical protein